MPSPSRVPSSRCWSLSTWARTWRSTSPSVAVWSRLSGCASRVLRVGSRPWRSRVRVLGGARFSRTPRTRASTAMAPQMTKSPAARSGQARSAEASRGQPRSVEVSRGQPRSAEVSRGQPRSAEVSRGQPGSARGHKRRKPARWSAYRSWRKSRPGRSLRPHRLGRSSQGESGLPVGRRTRAAMPRSGWPR